MRFPFRRRPPEADAGQHACEVDSVSTQAPDGGELIVYGGSWCIDCHVVTRFLDSRHIRFRWVDLGRDQASQERLSAAGYRAIPVVVLPDGRTLVEPSPRELAQALGLGPA